MTNYVKQFISNSFLLALASFFSLFISYLLRLLLAENLSISEFGLVYAIIVLFAFFSIFQHLGLNSALTKYIAEFKVENNFKKIKSAIGMVVIIQLLSSFIIALMFFLLSDYLAINYFKIAGAALYIKIYSVVLFISPLLISARSIFQGFQNIKYFSLTDFLKMFLVLILTFLFLKQEVGTLSIFIAYFISVIFTSFLFFILAITKVFPKFFIIAFKWDSILFKKLIYFGLPVLFYSVSGMVFGYIDTILLTLFRGLEEVALYNVALPTANALASFGLIFTSLLLPLVSELWAKKDSDRLTKGINLLYKNLFIILVPISLVFIIFSELILKILFGVEYIGASFVFRVLILGVIFISYSSLNGSILSGIGKPKVYGSITGVMVIFNLVLDLILIPKYGLNGAGISTLFSYILIFIVSSYFLRKYIPFHFKTKDLVLTLINSFIFVGAISFIRSKLQITLFLEVGISIFSASILYFGLLFLFKLVSLKDFLTIYKES